mgnify:CR=1 FL=1
MMKNEVLQERTGDWQVEVEIYETYVRKIPKDKEAVMEIIKTSGWGQRLDQEERTKAAQESINRHIQSVALIQASFMPLEFLGNPKFQAHGVILQDKVLMLKELFQVWEQQHEFTKIQKCLDDFIELHLLCWEYGLFELSFNFSLNNGVDGEGNLIFVDVGEFTNDLAVIKKNLEEKIWQHCWSVKNDLKVNVRDKYIKKASDRFTYENFQSLWQKRCI